MTDLREVHDVMMLLVAVSVGMAVTPTFVDGWFVTGLALVAGIPLGAFLWFVWMQVVNATLHGLSGLQEAADAR